MRKFEGAKPLQEHSFPSPLKEKGIEGVRLIKNLYRSQCS